MKRLFEEPDVYILKLKTETIMDMTISSEEIPEDEETRPPMPDNI